MFDLTGKKGLVMGIANEKSIAFGCAKAFKTQGAELAITYLNDKTKEFTAPLAEQLEADVYLPCDVRADGQLKALFQEIEQRWGKLDFVLHSIAYAPKEDLHARVTDCSKEGFLMAMDVSCHSFIRLARYAEPLMKDGGTLLTVTFYGGERVVENYNMMGPVKAALESATKYMAAELGDQGIRVHAISPGPIDTRAASGLDRFDALLEDARKRAPENKVVSVEDVGGLAAYLVSDAAKGLTGDTIYVDAGYHIIHFGH
jgi:enoyl-[acyl-carrier protein] reductase I